MTPEPVRTPCLCNALRRASRAVTRLYDDELRAVGLRTTQFSMLAYLNRAGEVKQGDIGDLMLLEQTTVTRNLRPLLSSGWLETRPGTDRRQRFVAITPSGQEKLREAAPAWISAQKKMKAVLSELTWQSLLAVLPDVAQAAIKVVVEPGDDT